LASENPREQRGEDPIAARAQETERVRFRQARTLEQVASERRAGARRTRLAHRLADIQGVSCLFDAHALDLAEDENFPGILFRNSTSFCGRVTVQTDELVVCATTETGS
jgi:hypothetical protein